MAHFKSVVTDIGAAKLTELLAAGGKLSLTRAAVGSGRTEADRAKLPGLVQPEAAEVQVGEMESASNGGSTILRLPVQVSNKGIKNPLPVRETAVYGNTGGEEFLFAVSWLEGEDTDNVIPVSALPEEGDTVHLFDVGVVLTNQEAASIQVEMGAGSFITEGKLIEELGKLHAQMENGLQAAGEELQKHTQNENIHVTLEEKASWNSKAAAASYTVTFPASGWSETAPFIQTVAVEGILETDNPVADIVLSDSGDTAKGELEAWSCVSKIETAAGSVTAACLENKPETDMTVQMKAVR